MTIPNNLDEFGQEALLSEIKRLGYEAVTMVWRPVAAALAWLDKVEGDFPQHMHQNDHIHIIYLGSDALEFTTFRLRFKESKNRLYVLPLRDRPTDLSMFNRHGLGWKHYRKQLLRNGAELILAGIYQFPRDLASNCRQGMGYREPAQTVVSREFMGAMGPS